ncbi:hypothetical protein SLA2020_231350 [Shorea laevis]
METILPQNIDWPVTILAARLDPPPPAYRPQEESGHTVPVHFFAPSLMTTTGRQLDYFNSACEACPSDPPYRRQY